MLKVCEVHLHVLHSDTYGVFTRSNLTAGSTTYVLLKSVQLLVSLRHVDWIQVSPLPEWNLNHIMLSICLKYLFPFSIFISGIPE